MAFSADFLDEVRARVGLAEVIGRRVRLTRRGREHIGLCPFHNEKTPSFTVNEDKGFYHCFGCGAHGSVIDFVMQTEGLAFPEAVERLAGEAGLAVPANTPEEQERSRQRQTLYGVLEAATAFFEKSLRMPAGAGAMAYLRGRGLTPATIERFRLGFAPDARGALKAALTREDVAEDLMVAAGLLIRPEEQDRAPYDRFRGRVMFPITDRRGQVIGFGGRILGGGEPKYLNSPETAVFHKGRTLYGLAQALPAVRDAAHVIVAEGYLDVIALAQNGLAHAVAPLGTALTEDQLALLWRLAEMPTVCFDGDDAGRRAAARAAERALPLLRPGRGLRFAMLPPGEDPDSLLARDGTDAMGRVLAAARPLSEVLWRMEVGGRTIATPEERAALEARLRRHTGRIADPTVRAHFDKVYRDRLWQAMAPRRGPGRPGAPPAAAVAASPGPPVDLARRREEILVTVLVTHPELFDDIGERLGSMAFSAPDLDNLRQEVLKTLAGAPGLDSRGLESQLRHNGYSQALDSVLSPRVFEHAFFARPDCAAETAREGWDETYGLYARDHLRAEVQAAQRRLADDMTAESFDRFRALKDQEHQAADDGGESGARARAPTTASGR